MKTKSVLGDLHISRSVLLAALIVTGLLCAGSAFAVSYEWVLNLDHNAGSTTTYNSTGGLADDGTT